MFSRTGFIRSLRSKRVARLYVATVLLLATPLLLAAHQLISPPSAEASASTAVRASTCRSIGVTKLCGVIEHYSPDQGYDAPILIRCNYRDPGTNHLLYEGQKSTRYCEDTDRVYVRTNEEIHCLIGNIIAGSAYWQTSFDATGWHKLDDLFAGSCTVTRD